MAVAPTGPEALADKLDQIARKALRLNALMLLPFVLATIDLVTGWVGLGWHLDAALLAAVVAQAYGLLILRRTARRVRSGELTGRPTWRHWARSTASLIGVLVWTAGIGYLIAGWPLALGLPLAAIVLMTPAVVIGRRRRRRLRAANPSS